jgi:SAM-dependent methyltransferase
MGKEFYDKAYRPGDSSNYDCGDHALERATNLWGMADAWISNTGLNERKVAQILEIGAGMAHLMKIHPGWHGAEYSKTAVERVKSREGQSVPIFEEDAQCLSFDDESFDGIFSFATFEHVPDPERAFAEIDRVLRVGGYALIAPAWNCRPWTVKKLVQRPWQELSLLEKMERLLIPLREHVVYRALSALPKRLYDECALFFSRGQNLHLRYLSLHPRWDLIEKYGHVSDDDAVASIDPHACILYFKSRGYRIVSHPTFLSRMLSRHEPVNIMKKKPYAGLKVMRGLNDVGE